MVSTGEAVVGRRSFTRALFDMDPDESGMQSMSSSRSSGSSTRLTRTQAFVSQLSLSAWTRPVSSAVDDQSGRIVEDAQGKSSLALLEMKYSHTVRIHAQLQRIGLCRSSRSEVFPHRLASSSDAT